MKCKLIVEREVMEFFPHTQNRMAPLELVAQCRREGGRLIAPIGAIIEDPDCWRIVLMGQAEPADDECKSRCTQTDSERAAALQAAARLNAGIAPEDFELFDRGYIVGYDKNGAYRPGPNWAEYEKQKAAKTPEESDI